jgi:hypothetical protein
MGALFTAHDFHGDDIAALTGYGRGNVGDDAHPVFKNKFEFEIHRCALLSWLSWLIRLSL